MSSKPGLSTRLTTYTKNHPRADDSGGKALENALNQLKEAKKQTKKRKDAERQRKAKLQAEDDAEALLEERRWQASHGGGQDVNDLFDDEEQQEMDDDPFADFDDAELMAEDEVIDNARVQPVLGKRGRPKRVDESDAEDHEDDVDDGNSAAGDDDSDGKEADGVDEDEIFQEALRMVRARKAEEQRTVKRRQLNSGAPAEKAKQRGPTFSVSGPSTVRSKLPARRVEKDKSAQATATSNSSSSPRASSAPPSTPTRPAKSGNKARLVDQTPVSKTVTKRACLLVRVFLATINAFPDDATLEAQLKACHMDSKKHLVDAGVLNAQDQTRSLNSESRKIMKDRLSQLRGEIKTKAQSAVSGIYGISSKLSKEEIEALIKKLLRKAAFTFRDPEKRSGLFANEIFAVLLAQQWFDPNKKSSEGVGDYAASFNPIPTPLIALIATAVECALKSWESGTYKNVSFTEHDYAKVYRRHSRSLARFEEKQPANLLKLCRKLWEDSWALAGNSPLDTDEVEDDIDDADFEAEEIGGRD